MSSNQSAAEQIARNITPATQFKVVFGEPGMLPFRLQIFPTLGGFGPLFVAFGMFGTLKSEGRLALLFFFSLAGAVMTSAALMILFREIVSLRQLLAVKNQEHVPS